MIKLFIFPIFCIMTLPTANNFSLNVPDFMVSPCLCQLNLQVLTSKVDGLLVLYYEIFSPLLTKPSINYISTGKLSLQKGNHACSTNFPFSS